MTSREKDKEITATARQLAKNVYEHAQITLRLSAASRAIEDYFDNPGLKTIDGLKALVGKAGAAVGRIWDIRIILGKLATRAKNRHNQEEGGEC